MTSTIQHFTSHGVRCTGELLLPDSEGPHPCVVMAHGFAGQRDFALMPFARRFVEAGLGVFLFDYRGSGDSDGLPRQLVSPRRQIQDYHAALAHVRSQPGVDPDRIGLWGTSFSGGHVLVVASQDQRVRAVSSLVPFTNGVASLRRIPPAMMLKLTWHGLRDLAQTLTGGPSHTLPVVGRPGELAMMSSPEAVDGYLSMVPPGSRWKNATPARIALGVGLYMPSRHAGRVDCPTLVIAGRKDTVVPMGSIREVADTIRDCRLEILDCNHFQAYEGEWFEQVSAMQTAFLADKLGA